MHKLHELTQQVLNSNMGDDSNQVFFSYDGERAWILWKEHNANTPPNFFWKIFGGFKIEKLLQIVCQYMFDLKQARAS
jgi:hypothetical protein